ncbi:hypothetical protein O0I10_004889 [Lichtheimia ornata]|uniref:COP9 signalosome complex subunit 4 n=1 Tax=Lichtheimia ornata TaxID=688661 RepID=A0AAD7XWC4_9FUNG|nr:uncharacterized protein O0I10_004889 [Lichtheimia ornata]KAJ8659524.1 hypothetical protein O0I10_004889 [Lichtheimia ornata]
MKRIILKQPKYYKAFNLIRVIGAFQMNTSLGFISNDLVLNLTFKLCQARILDAKRRFLEAATKYHELSYETRIDESDRLRCLMYAVQCAVLAGVGLQRLCRLATLYKDERTHRHLATFPIPGKPYMDRMIRQNEGADFVATLQHHHCTIREYNLLSASKFTTISHSMNMQLIECFELQGGGICRSHDQ